MIFQDYNLIEDINVYQNICLPLTFLGHTDFSIIDEVIKKVDIEDIKHSKVTEISSGQMQRVAIARALVKNSAMILADEPTGNLDSKNTKIVMDLLKEISKDRLVVVITHDDEAANEYGDRTIQIEDGTILEDICKNPSINEYDKSLEKSTDFIKPKVTFKQQLDFTFGFIRNSFSRSLAIFIILILIPLIGSLLCGYAFFDVSTSFKKYQTKYGSNYVTFSSEINGSAVYYKLDDYMEIFNKYGEDNVFELYSIYVPIANNTSDIDTFYQPVIKNLIIDDTDRVKYYDGDAPQKANEIAITDYLVDSYYYYTDNLIDVGDRLSIGGKSYDITGIIKTNFSDYINADFSDTFVRLAFEENLVFYNSIFTTSSGYVKIHNESTYFVEQMTYTISPSVSDYTVPVRKTAYITVRNVKAGVPSYSYGLSSDTPNKTVAALSQSLWESYMELAPRHIGRVNSSSFICTSTSRYSISVRVGYIYQRGSYNLYGTEGELVLSDSAYQNYIAKQEGSRFLISSSSSVYREVLYNENITNPSFTYAKATWVRAESSKYIMYEFLITLIIVMLVFSYLINNMTLNIEKKKIGIKFSFGISKMDIVVPYILEVVLYIITGIVLSLITLKLVVPLIMTGLVYNSPQELLEYEFFYIANSNILVWDIVIYSIMLVSLFIMILSICRKSPIEIIKDL